MEKLRENREMSRNNSNKDSSPRKQKTSFEVDTTHYLSGRSLDGTPWHAVIQDSLQLSDWEVTVAFMKFMIGIAVLNFPSQAA